MKTRGGKRREWKKKGHQSCKKQYQAYVREQLKIKKMTNDSFGKWKPMEELDLRSRALYCA